MKLRQSVRRRSFATLSLATFTASLFASDAGAALVKITDATYSGTFTAGSPEAITGAANLTSFTTSGGTTSNLLGATASSVVTTNLVSSVTTPAPTADVAASGLTAHDGINNMQSGNFQFGQTLTSSTPIFIIESTPQSSTVGDPTTVTLLDASNAAVGTYTLSLVATDFTTSPANDTASALATLTYQAGQGNLVGKLGGVMFTLGDFAGAGDLSTVTGIRIVSPGPVGGTAIIDPNIVGIAVPEPTSLALIALSVGGLLARRRRLA